MTVAVSAMAADLATEATTSGSSLRLLCIEYIAKGVFETVACVSTSAK